MLAGQGICKFGLLLALTNVAKAADDRQDRCSGESMAGRACFLIEKPSPVFQPAADFNWLLAVSLHHCSMIWGRRIEAMPAAGTDPMTIGQILKISKTIGNHGREGCGECDDHEDLVAGARLSRHWRTYPRFLTYIKASWNAFSTCSGPFQTTSTKDQTRNIMMRSFTSQFLSMPLLMWAATASPLNMARDNTGINWTPCDFPNASLPVQCANLSVPLDYSSSNSSETMTLPVFRVQAAVDEASKKGSILYNCGGPGSDCVNDLISLGDVLQA